VRSGSAGTMECMDEDLQTGDKPQRPNDVLFWRGDGAVLALPWADQRQWIFEASGNRLMLIWPRMDVTLWGRHLDKLAEGIQSRRLTELRQATPKEVAEDGNGKPVIEIMKFESYR
jgi:hypothetical protein